MLWAWLALYLYLCGAALSWFLTEEDDRNDLFGVGLSLLWPVAAPILIAGTVAEKLARRGRAVPGQR